MQLPIILRAGLVALIASTIAFLVLPARADDREQIATIAINGTGTADAAPDIAYVTSGVLSEARTAREALDANTAAMTKVIATLKEAGIEPRDISTSNFNVNPVYTHYRPKPGEEARPPRITGYRVTNNVSVRVRDLGNLGAVLDRIVSDGANSINGIRFAIDKDQELRDEARKRAVVDAVRKAEILAEAAGVGLGRIMSITEGHVARPPVPVMRMAARAEAMDASPVPVEAGEQTLTVNVSVIWEIDQ